jgi:hypothetical protein
VSLLGPLVAGLHREYPGMCQGHNTWEWRGHEVALGHDFSQHFGFSLAVIISPMPHILSLSSGEWLLSPFEGTLSDRHISHFIAMKKQNEISNNNHHHKLELSFCTLSTPKEFSCSGFPQELSYISYSSLTPAYFLVSIYVRRVCQFIAFVSGFFNQIQIFINHHIMSYVHGHKMS